MRIVATGSLAYDYIMTFPGLFGDHILPEKVQVLSVSFLADSLCKLRGGIAGNVAYNLALLGERPILASTVGQDFGEYRAALEQLNVDTRGIVEIKNDFTSSCFITTDKADNQIVTFYPGAMSYYDQLSLRHLDLDANDLVLISASDPRGMYRCIKDCQELGLPYIFDPGKQALRLEADLIRLGLQGAKVLVGNEYEFGLMAKHLNLTEEALIAQTPLTVMTLGKAGSKIYDNAANRQLTIPVAPPQIVADPTGAGDAYLAGLAFGLAHKLPLELTGRVAALAATYAIEKRGCQAHTYTRAEFLTRYTALFGASELATLLTN